MYKSEIRESVILELADKVRKQNYGSYLYSIRLEKVRLFEGAEIVFNFPVTALIGPNGGGKSTILNASACIYGPALPHKVFKKSHIGDEAMDGWKIEYELIEKEINPKGTIRTKIAFTQNVWHRETWFRRIVRTFGIDRTVPLTDRKGIALRKKLIISRDQRKTFTLDTKEVPDIDHIKSEAEKVLGKSLADFQLLEVTYTNATPEHIKKGTMKYHTKTTIYVGCNGGTRYSEFNFGSGEASVIRMVAEIETMPINSLVLIDEIENGLHPLAVQRMVEYFIDVAKRKSIQLIFTTHSDYALAPLPSEAVWASIDGKLQQGKLSVEVLRAISGRIDKRLAVFVEDEFAKTWVEATAREALGRNFEEIGIYPVNGDGNAVKIHLNHNANPALSFPSICLIDGDSQQREDEESNIYRLPGIMPELTIFNSVLRNIENNIALLTVACQRPLSKQNEVVIAVREVSQTNRDPHLLFNQIGLKLGFLPEAIVRGAFLTVWFQENPDDVNRIVEPMKKALDKIRK